MKTVTLTIQIEVEDSERKQNMDELLSEMEDCAAKKSYSIHNQDWECEDGELSDCEEHDWICTGHSEEYGVSGYKCRACGAEYVD